jgi:hypothetical protein
MGPGERWRRHRWAGFCVTSAISFLVGTADAHIDLRAPIPREQGLRREPNSNQKEGPCGQVENGRTSRVTVFAPGETIEVTWLETTNHRSYYRVAFDRFGDDAFPTFEGPGTGAEGIDPSGPCPADGQVILAYDMEDRSGGSHTLSVRLPDVECENCTLQVVQFMYDTITPYYFQCADLALRRSSIGDAGVGDETARDAGLDAGAADASGEPEPSAAAGCFGRIAPLDGSPMPVDDDSDREPPVASGPSEAPPPDPSANVPAPPSASPRTRSEGGFCSFAPLASSRARLLPTALLFAICALLAKMNRAARG